MTTRRKPAVSELGRLVTEAREARGWSMNRLAQEARLAATQVSKLESGERQDLLWSTAVRIADALGIPVQWLCGRLPDIVAVSGESSASIEVSGSAREFKQIVRALRDAKWKVLERPTWAELGYDKMPSAYHRPSTDLEARISELERELKNRG